MIAIISIILSLLSLGISAFNGYVAWKNRKLALLQDARKNPVLQCYLRVSFQKSDAQGRSFNLLVQVSNTSDTNNSIADAVLAVRYLTVDRVVMTVKLPAASNVEAGFVHGQGELLKLPQKLPAHEVVTGWLYFRAPKDLLAGMIIDSFELEIADTHGGKTSVTPNLMQEYRDEVSQA